MHDDAARLADTLIHDAPAFWTPTVVGLAVAAVLLAAACVTVIGVTRGPVLGRFRDTANAVALGVVAAAVGGGLIAANQHHRERVEFVAGHVAEYVQHHHDLVPVSERRFGVGAASARFDAVTDDGDLVRVMVRWEPLAPVVEGASLPEAYLPVRVSIEPVSPLR